MLVGYIINLVGPRQHFNSASLLIRLNVVLKNSSVILC